MIFTGCLKQFKVFFSLLFYIDAKATLIFKVYKPNQKIAIKGFYYFLFRAFSFLIIALQCIVPTDGRANIYRTDPH